jgi:hypothetical protein
VTPPAPAAVPHPDGAQAKLQIFTPLPLAVWYFVKYPGYCGLHSYETCSDLKSAL